MHFGYLFGFFGIAFGLFVNFIVLLNINSFGIPYFSPYIPIYKSSSDKPLFLSPIWKREKRSDFLNTKKSDSQEKISQKWKNIENT